MSETKLQNALWMAAAALLPAVLMLPFLNKAYHVDDPLFVWTAQQIVQEPLNFYGFMANWSRSATWMYQIQQNPPLLSYYLAPWGATFGWSEIVLHAALLPLTGLAGLGIYLLARLFCHNAFLAFAAAVVSPAFLVSATQVMSDVPMLALFVWAIYLWMRGLERESALLCLLSGLCIGLGALTKYFAASAVPLLIVYTLLQGPSRYRFVAYLLVPFGMLVAYEFATYRLYGLGLLADAFSFAQSHRDAQQASLSIKTMNTLVFLGGCVMPVLCLLPWLLSKRALQITLSLGGALIGLCYLLPIMAPDFLDAFHPLKTTFPLNFREPGASVYLTEVEIKPSSLQLAQWGLWFGTGLFIVFLFALDLYTRRDAKSVLLILWCVGTLMFVAILNHHVNARVILPLAPAAAIVCVRRMEWMKQFPQASKSYMRVWPLGPALALSLLVAVADYQLASTARQGARDIMAMEHEGTVWFTGHSGFQYYMEKLGAESIDVYRSFGQPGDTFVQPSNNWYPLLLGPHVTGDYEIIAYEPLPILTTSHFQRYAGFYSDYTGPVPFMFGTVPIEQYLIVDIRLQVLIEDL